MTDEELIINAVTKELTDAATNGLVPIIHQGMHPQHGNLYRVASDTAQLSVTMHELAIAASISGVSIIIG